MRLTEVNYDSGLPIDGYGPGFFRIAGERVEGPTLILVDTVETWGGYDDTALLTAAAETFDVLILGTGPEIAHPPGLFTGTLETAGIGIEPMASPQACRTYNVLLGEGRRVAAALLPV